MTIPAILLNITIWDEINFPKLVAVAPIPTKITENPAIKIKELSIIFLVKAGAIFFEVNSFVDIPEIYEI